MAVWLFWTLTRTPIYLLGRNRAEKRAERFPFSVHVRPQADEIIALIDRLTDEAEYLIIDLEGAKDQIVTFALSRTDLCIIPLDGSPMEARQAAQAVRLVQTTSSMIRSPIEYALLFTRTNAAFQTTDETPGAAGNEDE